MQSRQLNDRSMLVQFELKQNATVGVLFEEYEKLTATEKALFRLAVEMSQDTMDNISGHPLRADKDMLMLVQFELKQNAMVGVLVEEYAKLTETEKGLFRLAVRMNQDTRGSTSGYPHRTYNEPVSNIRTSDIKLRQIQPLARSLIKTLLEDYPTLLTDADIGNLMNRDYCQKTLGLYFGGFPLLRRRESGRKGSANDHQARYYVKLYAGKFYVCSQWWKDDHLSNARSLLRFVTGLAKRNPNHPGVPALERHKRALQDYIG